MRCKKHLSDVSSTVGVCATCLRHRLLSLIELEPGPETEPPIQSQSNHSHRNLNCNHDQIPPRKNQNAADKFRLIFHQKSPSPSSSSSSSNSVPNNHNPIVVAYANTKGMSPVNELENDSESSKVTRPTPARVKQKSAARGGTRSFCFGPLVRATPSRRCNGGGGEKLGFPAEIRVLATGVKSGSNNKGSIGNCDNNLNRSRKLADFGKENPNR